MRWYDLRRAGLLYSVAAVSGIVPLHGLSYGPPNKSVNALSVILCVGLDGASLLFGSSNLYCSNTRHIFSLSLFLCLSQRNFAKGIDL